MTNTLPDKQLDWSVDAVRLIHTSLTQCFYVFPRIDNAAQQNAVCLYFTISLLP